MAIVTQTINKQLSKRARRKKRAKQRKKELAQQQALINKNITELENMNNDADKIDYTFENLENSTDPQAKAFSKVFSSFYTPENSNPTSTEKSSDDNKLTPYNSDYNQNGLHHYQPDEDLGSNPTDKPTKLSNKKRKLRDRLSIAQLKQVVDRPDLVEIHDPNSPDPILLIHLKSYRNSVPVPSHWIEKRKYLQGKRGIEKPPFQLPKAIEETGIGDIRDHQQTKDSSKSRSQKQRERMNPKMGKIDIDYQKLHAAFFKYMEKPRMTSHGDLYYMGKEYEVKFRRHRPGNLSKRLKNALHIQENCPPPYLINMQRFGPPPSYPDLKIPGLNAPIPSGCRYGYGDGQWGKPPVDEHGYPLYGDPFGMNINNNELDEEPQNGELWGNVNESAEEYEESSDEEENEEIESEKTEKVSTAVDTGVLSTVSGTTSVTSGLETPPVITIRKDTGVETPGTESVHKPAPQLYQVLDQKEAHVSSKSAFGSTHIYSIAAEEQQQKLRRVSETNKVQVALNEDELASLDEMTIKKKYQEQIDAEKEKRNLQKEDLGLMKNDRLKKKMRKKKDDIGGYKF